MSEVPVRVVKVGGSLLERHELPRQLNDWLRRQAPAFHIFVPGGGEFIESIRNWQPRYGLSEAEAHWLCIEALSITSQVLARVLQAPRITDWNTLQQQIASCAAQAAIVFDLQTWLREAEPHVPPEALPHNWQVTTDSLAARLAESLAAGELVLLKSAAPPAHDVAFATLAVDGYLDRYFPRIAPRLQRITLEQLPLA